MRMQDDSIGGREELLARMREMAKENEDNMKGCTYRYTGASSQNSYDRGSREKERGSTFGFRLLLCLVIWGGFFWMHMEDAPVMGYDTQKVVEAVSTDVGLQELKDSVKIEPKQP